MVCVWFNIRAHLQYMITQLQGRMATVKKPKVGEIKAISKSVCKPTLSTTAMLILEAVKMSRHTLSFPETKMCRIY